MQKRILAFFLSVTLCLLSVTAGFTASAEKPTDGLERFRADLLQMIRTYDRADSEIAPEYVEPQPQPPQNPIPAFPAFPVPELMQQEVSGALYASGGQARRFSTKRLIVKAKQNVDLQGAVECVSGYRNLYILQYATEAAAQAAYQYYQAQPAVVYVEPDGICIQQDAPAPAQQDAIAQIRSWATQEIGFSDIRDTLAARVLPEVVVAILDSGVDTDHELLAPRLLENPFNLSDTGERNSSEDDYGHGTHVAGIVVQNTPNNVKIKPYKVLNNQGKGPNSLVAIAIDCAVADGADIINMSLAGQEESRLMTETVDAAVKQGVSVVAAAGNNRADLSVHRYYPACVESAVTVSALTQYGDLAYYSNYNGPIDIAAPGDNIQSSGLNNTYLLKSGTSMAAPMVAAGLAIVRAVYPHKTAKETEEMLKSYAVQMTERNGENRFGAGQLYLKYILDRQPKTLAPQFSVPAGEFAESFLLQLSCSEKDAVILYVLNSESDFPSIGLWNGRKYAQPLQISTDTKVSAVAIAKGKLASSVVTNRYVRADRSEEDDYDIDRTGTVTRYVGTKQEIVVPAVIRGIPVTAIGAKVFQDRKDLRSVSLPDSVTRIGYAAFSGCTGLESVSGRGIRTVDMAAFQNSAVQSFPFAQLERIGIQAFSGCNRLENVDLAAAQSVEMSAFENAKGVQSLYAENLKTVGMNAFRGSDVETVFLPKLETLGVSAFENCSYLQSVSLPLTEEAPLYAFSNCISLHKLELPRLKKIGMEAFMNTALPYVALSAVTEIGQAAFAGCSALRMAYLPLAERVGTQAFARCSALWMPYLPKLQVLEKETFSGCKCLRTLWLPQVHTVVRGAFDGCVIEGLQLERAALVSSLPQTLSALVLACDVSSIDTKASDAPFAVYGNPNSYAQRFAEQTNRAFVEVPALIWKLPAAVGETEDCLYAPAVGFSCTYQWYKNTVCSNENGELLVGADKPYYMPQLCDDAAAYYCVITSDDGTAKQIYTTPAVQNHPRFQKPETAAYDAAVAAAASIDRSRYPQESLAALDALLTLETENLTALQQPLLDEQVERIWNALYTMRSFAAGDTDRDGSVTAVDARRILQTVVGLNPTQPADLWLLDVNADGAVTAVDARQILQMVVGILPMPSGKPPYTP